MVEKSILEELESLPADRRCMLNRLKRVEGQLRGIQRMIVEGKPCMEILIQLSAARKAMQNACIEILKGYINQCLANPQNMRMEEVERLISTLIDICPLPPEEENKD